MPGADQAALDEASAALGCGGVVVYPTETFYGIGADATREAAVQRVAALKGRDAGKPILVLVASREMLTEVVSSLPETAGRLIGRFWPGPLTLVLPARRGLSPFLTGGRDAIGVRVSSHPVARALVERLGKPLTATSANPAGEEPASDPERARRYFGDRVDVYVDAGATPGGPASTVLDLSGPVPILVREGAVSAAALADAGVVAIGAKK